MRVSVRVGTCAKQLGAKLAGDSPFLLLCLTPLHSNTVAFSSQPLTHPYSSRFTIVEVQRALIAGAMHGASLPASDSAQKRQVTRDGLIFIVSHLGGFTAGECPVQSSECR